MVFESKCSENKKVVIWFWNHDSCLIYFAFVTNFIQDQSQLNTNVVKRELSGKMLEHIALQIQYIEDLLVQNMVGEILTVCF